MVMAPRAVACGVWSTGMSRRVVGVAVGGLPEWLDGLDHDFGVGCDRWVVAPVVDLAHGDRGSGVLDVGLSGAAHEGGLGEVDVEDDLAWFRRWFRGLVWCGLVEVERELLAGQEPGGHGAAHVEGLG